MKFENILKFIPAIIGIFLFLIGAILKIKYAPTGFDEFITGNGYLLIIIGILACILNIAFNYIINDTSYEQSNPKEGK